MITRSFRILLYSYNCGFKQSVVPLAARTSNQICDFRVYSNFVNSELGAKPAPKKERTKTPEVLKVSLLDENNAIVSIMTLPEAEKLAASKQLKLVRIIDKSIQTARPVYKLMADAQYIQEDLQLRRQKKEERKKSGSYLKGEKVLVMSSKITDYDVDMKIRKAIKWLEKKFEIRVLISAPSDKSSAQEELFQKIEKAVKGKSRILQKIYSSGNLKFQILPLKDEETNENSRSEEKTDAVKESSSDKNSL